MKTFLQVTVCVVLLIAIISGGMALGNQVNYRDCIGQATFFNTEYTYQWWYGCQLKINNVWWWWNFRVNVPPGPGPL